MTPDKVGPKRSVKPRPEPQGGLAQILRSTPLFSQFSDRALEEIAGHFTERSYARGDILWHAGDEGNEFLVVVSGRLDVLGASTDGTETLVGRVDPGECVGEMALLLDERRSATVKCSRAARTLVLLKPEFRRVVRDDPTLLANLAGPLSRRAASLARRRPVRRGSIVVGVVSEPGVPGASLVAAAIAQLARDELKSDVLLLRISDGGIPIRKFVRAEGLPKEVTATGKHPEVIEVAADGTLAAEELVSTVDALLNAFGEGVKLLVVDLPRIAQAPVAFAASACEYVVQVADRQMPAVESSARVLQVINRHSAPGASTGAPIPLNHCEPFVLPDEPAFAAFRASSGDRLLLNRRHPATRVLGRLTRKIMGATVGVALGGGAAFGIAHVGVLHALDDAGIPVDLLAGTSMGSIVAIGYAGGMTGAELRNVAGEFGNLRKTLAALDFSWSGTGLMDGRKMVQSFAGLLPMSRFEELVLPCQTVATDIQSGERVVIGTGNLAEAFRASTSIPMIFAPVQHDGRFLVDGAIIDPVPADVVQEMGADVVIAVNVVPQLDREVSTAFSKASELLTRLNPLARSSGAVGAPHIVDTMMNSLQITQHELGKFKALSADVLVNVDLTEFTWIDFPRAAEIAHKGAEATKAMVPEIRSLYRARLNGL
jgi:NTE family protein